MSEALTGRLDNRTNPVSPRLVSLDALRGFDMWWIIGGDLLLRSLVQASGRESWQWIPDQLTHVPWEGFHFIDLIFPLFLFMIGVAIPFSMAKRLARGDSRTRIYGHLLLRVAILIVLGMMVNGSLLTYDPKQFQLTYSVLQMLALGYLVASLLFLHLRLRWQVVATAVMLVGYWALLAFVPGPGHEIGKFREGCNAGDWITEFLVGKWRGYQVGWIVGILGHASTAMLGVFAGQLLRSPQSDGRKLGGLAALGLSCLSVGYVWSGWFVQHLAAAGVGDEPDRLADLVPDHQESLDQHLCPVRGRLELPAAGFVLPDHRRLEDPPLGLSVHRDRLELHFRVHVLAVGQRRVPQCGRGVPARPSAVCRSRLVRADRLGRRHGRAVAAVVVSSL